MKTISLPIIALLLITGPALSQSQSEHQQHHPAASVPGAQAQASPGVTPSQQPATAGQPQTNAPSGPMVGSMQGMMHGQGQSGSGTMMGSPSGMMMSCPMMQGGVRGMMGARSTGGGMGADPMAMPMMAARGHMMKVVFAIADTSGDGALSFEEVTAVHKRIFDRVDLNKDGKVTVDELQTFTRE
ncbi:MAG: EF-hand protein [Microvirga sp.]|jgi:hypothetical protein|nr:EF-hand protein [Microvirga sp.]